MDKLSLRAFEELLNSGHVRLLPLRESRRVFERKILQLLAFTFTDATGHFLGSSEPQQKAKGTLGDVALESNTAGTGDADEQR